MTDALVQDCLSLGAVLCPVVRVPMFILFT